MDSRLLNVFYDDHFENNNYGKFDTDPNFWSSENEALGFQLSETLHGILPMSPTQESKMFFDAPVDKSCYSLPVDNAFRKHIDFLDCDSNELSQSTTTQSMKQLLSENSNEYCDSNLQTGSENNSSGEEDDYRSVSRTTFRSRTDSSSIGDYESHSSDYDESYGGIVECDNKIKIEGRTFGGNLIEELVPIIENNPSIVESKMNKYDPTIGGATTTPISSEAGNNGQLLDDVFDLGIDTTTFDLAAFITQDDHTLSQQTSPKKSETSVKSVKMQSSDSELSDSDSSIVDVETVEGESPLITSFNESKTNSEEKPKMSTRAKSNFSIVPNKRQCDILKRKRGLASKCSPTNKKVVIPTKRVENIYNKVSKPQPLLLLEIPPNPKIPTREKPKVEVQLEKGNKEEKPSNNKITSNENINMQPAVTDSTPIKRKLNLEEYKKRREKSTPHQISVNQNTIKGGLSTNILKTSTVVETAPIKSLDDKLIVRESMVYSLVNNKLSENENIYNKNQDDPITKAKNKVLRLQELKKAQQIKIIDSTVSSKVGRVTKLLPLNEIVKDTYSTTNNKNLQTTAINNSEYEEITIVSTGSNTDLTIPIIKSNKSNMPSSSRSLLKSSELLLNINDTFKKVKSSDNVKLSSHSLIASIQEVVVKKSLSNMPINSLSKNINECHGENKIIMHLRKDRIKTITNSTSTQTELSPEFPMLNFLQKFSSKDKSKRAVRKFRRSDTSLNLCNDDSSDSDSNLESVRDKNKRDRKKRKSRYSRSRSRTRLSTRSRSRSRSPSFSSSNLRNRSPSPSPPSCSNSSRNLPSSLSFHKKRRIEGSVAQPAVEERRIVYVGRIEDETSREDLRRKFLAYGPIKHITMHYKDTGMKYGFITFERASDAFQVIDNGTKDGSINMYDISFGGRRAFCRATYADLDNAMDNYPTYSYTPAKSVPKEDDSFEALLQKVKAKMSSSKPTNPDV